MVGRIQADGELLRVEGCPGRELRDSLLIPVGQARQTPAGEQRQRASGVDLLGGSRCLAVAGQNREIIEWAGTKECPALCAPDRVERCQCGAGQDIDPGRRRGGAAAQVQEFAQHAVKRAQPVCHCCRVGLVALGHHFEIIVVIGPVFGAACPATERERGGSYQPNGGGAPHGLLAAW